MTIKGCKENFLYNFLLVIIILMIQNSIEILILKLGSTLCIAQIGYIAFMSNFVRNKLHVENVCLLTAKTN